MKHYTARWAQAGHPSIANVIFDASNDEVASRRADKIARELGVANTPRTITVAGCCIQCITRGVKDRP